MQPSERSAPLPSAPKVFGVLSIVFASLTLLWGLLTSFMVVIPWAIGRFADSVPGKDAAGEKMLAAVKAVYGGMGAIGLILAVFSALLLAVGIGQLRYRRWARVATVWWSQAALLALVGMIAISVLVIGPGYRDLFTASALKDGAAAPDLGAFSTIFGGTFSGLFVVFYAPYPVLLLAFFTRERVRDAMLY